MLPRSILMLDEGIVSYCKCNRRQCQDTAFAVTESTFHPVENGVQRERGSGSFGLTIFVDLRSEMDCAKLYTFLSRKEFNFQFLFQRSGIVCKIVA